MIFWHSARILPCSGKSYTPFQLAKASGFVEIPNKIIHACDLKSALNDRFCAIKRTVLKSQFVSSAASSSKCLKKKFSIFTAQDQATKSRHFYEPVNIKIIRGDSWTLFCFGRHHYHMVNVSFTFNNKLIRILAIW